MTPAQIDRSLQIVQDIFLQFRPRVQAAAGNIAHTAKDDGSPTTDLDIEIENTVIGELTRQFPEVPAYGEESGYQEDQDGTLWLVDPLDGTKSFIAGIPGYTSMAVLIQNHEAVASVIYNPHSDELYVAKKGQGALKNGKRLDLSKIPLPRLAYGRERLIDGINDMLQPMSVRCEAGPSGAGYGFGLVADGRLAARFNFPHQPGGGNIHDYTPGALLVREAGGVIVSVEGSEYTYKTRSFVACHPALESLVRNNAKKLRELEMQTA